MEKVKHKRGDLSPCGTKRFWQYQKHVSKKTGQRCERWIPVENYDRYRKQACFNNELGCARSEYIKTQQARARAKAKSECN